MTRGLKGCYVYFTDREASEYFRQLIEAPVVTAEGSQPQSTVVLDSTNIEPFRRLKSNEAKPYINCVPLIDLKIAAGTFSDTQTIDPDKVDWVELPDIFQPKPGLFVAKVIGESMNRRIPNGSWCLFKMNPTGSRQGKVVVVQHRSIYDSNCSAGFTIKVYESLKLHSNDLWRHSKISLRPDSTDPAFLPIEIEEADAEWLTVIAELSAVLN